MAYGIHIDSFDFRAKCPVPRRFKSKTEETMWVLRNSWRVSVFWLTETDRRAKLVDDLIARGELKLEPEGYPWSKIVKAPSALAEPTQEQGAS